MREDEQIIQTAARLFADLGYDSTSAELIAEAAGTDVHALNQATGGKRALYRTVMNAAFQAEQEMLQGALASLTPDAGGAHRLADTYLDFHTGNPQFASLAMHRWMGDAADISEMEADYTSPQVHGVTSAIDSLIPADVSAQFLVRTIVWCVFGFLSGGLPERGRTPWTRTTAEINEFRTYLHTLIDRMLAPTLPRPDTPQ